MSGSAKIGSNSFIVIGGQFASIVIRFLSNIILAWFLVPDDFGIAAIITTIFMGLSMLSDVGIHDSIIRSKYGEDADFQKAAFYAQMVRGIVLYAIIFGISGYVADFYDKDILAAGLKVGGLSLLLDGFYSVRVHELQRNHQVKTIVLFELGVQAIATLLVLTICVIYPTVWALIVSHVFNTGLRLIGSHWIAPMKRSLERVSMAHVRRIISFGKWIFLSTLFQYIITQSDKLFIGKLADASTLGVYAIASSLAAIPLLLSYQLGAKIVYPVLSEAARESKGAYGQRLGEVLGRIFPLLFVFVVIIFAVAPLFFKLLYQAAYHSAGYYTQILVVMTWFMILYDIYQKIPVSYGLPKVTALASGVTALLRIVFSVVLYYRFGLTGFVFGLAAGSIMGVVAVQVWMRMNGIGGTLAELYPSLGIVGLLLIHHQAAARYGEHLAFDVVTALLGLALAAGFVFRTYNAQIMGLFARKGWLKAS